MPQVSPLRRTALNSVHRSLCAKMVDFGGWDMPVQYSGILAEHMAVRKSVGVFDVSHMGEIEIRGPQAAQLDRKSTRLNSSHLGTSYAVFCLKKRYWCTV